MTKSAYIRIFLFLFITALQLCPTISRASNDDLQEIRHVLLLNSYHQRMTWVKDIVQGVEEVLRPNENNLTLHIENMDSKVFNSVEYFDSFKEYLRVKYRDTRFSLILSSDNNAYDFLRKNSAELFPDVVVSFCGVNDFHPKQLGGLPNFTGVAEIFSARETVEMALQLHPTVKEIYIINDYLKTGRAWARNIEKDLEQIAENITLRHAENLPIDQLMTEIEMLPNNTLVLLGVYFSDKDGRYFTYERIGAMLSRASNVPVYCLLEFNVGKGVVGGRVISGLYQGKAMAEIGKELLSGRRPTEIPVIQSGSNRLIFDYTQLERFGIDEAKLPPNSFLINKPYSFYEEYKTQVWTVATFIVILLITIIGLGINVIWRLHAERELKESEKRFKQLANASWEAIIVHRQGVLIQANDTFYQMFGYSPKEVDGESVLERLVAPNSIDKVSNNVAQGLVGPYEITARRKNGTFFPVEVRVREMEFKGEQVRMAALRDLSERKQFEERLTQSQKLEAMGTLAGGIAHDFNNILSAIIGYSELIQLKTADDAETTKYIKEVLRAGQRAKNLVQQILTFARKGKEERKPIQVSLIIKEALKLLRATLPTTIEIQSEILSSATVQSEASRIHQIIMNLCTNAHKAMPEGGTLAVSLKEVELSEETVAPHVGVSPGRYVELKVQDTGIGMTEEVKQRIFDPFFTTREQGEGTGLGLSVVHGIANECKGFITVESTPDEGSSFTIYLPVSETETVESIGEEHSLPGGNERILMLDDEQPIAEMVGAMLSRLGYEVTVFMDGLEALEAFSANPDQFDLIITDMTMPKISGDRLAKEMFAIRPDVPVIICTGYTEKLTPEEARKIGVKDFAMKPVEMAKLAEIIRNALGNGRGGV